MKGNRQIGLDGRIFINDCLTDGIFFVYSIILSGILGAIGDVMKLTGKSSFVMKSLPNGLLTNGLIIMDLACCLGLVLVAYYVYFMNCGESMPKLGVKPLIYLEYARLAYYGMLIYNILYRFSDEILHSGTYPIAMSIFYVVYLGWLVTCAFAAMFILTVLNQNMIRRSYSDSFKMLALIGLGINIVMPIVFFITKIWIKGAGDGFYSAGICDFIRLGVAPIFYAAIWFLFLNAIDQVDRVFSEVDNAIRDKNYRIEFEEEPEKAKKSKSKDGKKKKKAKTVKSKGASDSVPSETDGASIDSADVSGTDTPGISAEIAFQTAFDAPADNQDSETNDTGNTGDMVDINSLLNKPADETSSAASGENADTPLADAQDEASSENGGSDKQ